MIERESGSKTALFTRSLPGLPAFLAVPSILQQSQFFLYKINLWGYQEIDGRKVCGDMEKQCEKTQKKYVWFVVLLIFVILCLAAFDSRMIVRRYDVDATEISTPVRVVLVTDLHSCDYGEGQKTLLDAVDECAPDLILLGGDIFDA